MNSDKNEWIMVISRDSLEVEEGREWSDVSLTTSRPQFPADIYVHITEINTNKIRLNDADDATPLGTAITFFYCRNLSGVEGGKGGGGGWKEEEFL